MYLLNYAISQMGYWVSFLLIPILVEVIVALAHFFMLLYKTWHKKPHQPLSFYPYLTIIIPIYNSERTLYQCIAALAESDYQTDRLQIILANNHTPDQSFDVFQKAQLDFPFLNIQWMNTDAGKARALNSAIYSSSGAYVINIDSDGYLERHALAYLVEAFESDPSISAMTGTILTQKEAIKQTRSWGLRTLQKVEYYEYAQSFLSGRNVESTSNHLFTMAGAFSAFRREVLLETFLYSIDTVGEDTDMTFQVRDRLAGKVVLCPDAQFFIDPIESTRQLYTQRQRWQRGQIEVTQKFSHKRMQIMDFFKDFMVRRMMVDHTFIFPKMIWIFATFVLIYLGYPPKILLISYIIIYLLYVFLTLLNHINVFLLLKPFPEERRFFGRLLPYILLVPLYNFCLSWVRLIGVINTMMVPAAWTVRNQKQEAEAVKAVVRSDVEVLFRKREKK
ncbi:putative glycosyltransferase, exosortase G system-associated [Oscillospiraceae bacterium HV4-5-C5C]|nr:putative glycosyltransferase, exosortase G system-associated [Oscillospiraceae bacterium HV4-5-C5C]